jgi:hypothetical protein
MVLYLLGSKLGIVNNQSALSSRTIEEDWSHIVEVTIDTKLEVSSVYILEKIENRLDDVAIHNTPEDGLTIVQSVDLGPLLLTFGSKVRIWSN